MCQISITMKTFAILLFATLPCFAQESLTAKADLSNWAFESNEGPEAAQKSWKLEDGVLSTTGKPTGFIRTMESFENYTLTLEWRWLPGTENGNSGLLVHAGETGEGKTWPPCFEPQLQQNSAGDIWMIGGKLEATGKNEGDRWHRTADPKEKPVGEWNTMTVVCKDDTLTIHVNGTLVNEAKKLSRTSGSIALQSEGAPIQFRNIILKD